MFASTSVAAFVGKYVVMHLNNVKFCWEPSFCSAQ